MRGVLRIAKVSGQATERVWSQVVVLTADGGGVGTLVVAVSVHGDGEGVAAEEGRILVVALEKACVEWREHETNTQELWNMIKRLVDETGIAADITAWWMGEGRVSIVGWGLGGVVLMRGDQVKQIFSGSEGRMRAIEGPWRIGDRWLIGTAGLITEMAPEFCTRILGFGSAQQAGEELATQVTATVDSEGVAAVIAHVVDADSGVVEEEEQVGGDDRPQVYLRQESRRKRAVLIGLALLVLFTISIGVGWQKRQAALWEHRYQAVQESVNRLVQEAQQNTSPLNARDLVLRARQQLKDATQAFAGRKEYEEKLAADGLRLEQIYAQVSGEKQAVVGTWYDLKLIRQDIFGEHMALSGNILAVLDGQHGVVGTVTTDSKQADLVGGGSLLNGASLVALSGKRGVALGSSGVVEVAVAKKTSALLVERDAEWQRIVGIGLFAGNVYLVDAGAGAVWRYPGLSAGVGSKQQWLGAGVNVEFVSVTDMAIDGDIWLLSTSGKIQHLRRGVPMAFGVKNLDTPFTNPTAIYTNEDLELIYILDRGNTRVVALTKEGEYRQQYQWDGLSGVSDMVVASDIGKILLLSGTTIYSIDL